MCVITFVVTGTLVSMTVPMTRDGLSRVSDMAGEQSIQCVVVTIGGHTVLYAYSFLPSPFGYKPPIFRSYVVLWVRARGRCCVVRRGSATLAKQPSVARGLELGEHIAPTMAGLMGVGQRVEGLATEMRVASATVYAGLSGDVQGPSVRNACILHLIAVYFSATVKRK